MKTLRSLRLLAAALVWIGLTALFVVPAAASCAALGWLARIQLVPAILAGEVVALVALAVLIAVGGRLYCATVCPLGFAQDLVRALARRLGLRPAARLKPETRAVRIVRRTLLAAFLAAVPLGWAALLEPYGIYGRFCAAAAARPDTLSAAAALWSFAPCGLILAAALFWPRAWCHLACPVGTLLGFAARCARVRVRIDPARCVGCNRCVAACDAGCISAGKDKAVDATRCLLCLKCAAACHAGALGLVDGYGKRKESGR